MTAPLTARGEEELKGLGGRVARSGSWDLVAALSLLTRSLGALEAPGRAAASAQGWGALARAGAGQSLEPRRRGRAAPRRPLAGFPPVRPRPACAGDPDCGGASQGGGAAPLARGAEAAAAGCAWQVDFPPRRSPPEAGAAHGSPRQLLEMSCSVRICSPGRCRRGL